MDQDNQTHCGDSAGQGKSSESEDLEEYDGKLPQMSLEVGKCPQKQRKSHESCNREESSVGDRDYDHYESLPGAVDLSSVKSYSDDEEEGDDDFDMEGIPMPRLASSTIPIQLEVTTPRSGRYTSEDPLFQGVCLYATTSNKTSEEKTKRTPTKEALEKPRATTPWFFTSVFQHLLEMQRQRVDEYME